MSHKVLHLPDLNVYRMGTSILLVMTNDGIFDTGHPFVLASEFVTEYNFPSPRYVDGDLVDPEYRPSPLQQRLAKALSMVKGVATVTFGNFFTHLECRPEENGGGMEAIFHEVRDVRTTVYKELFLETNAINARAEQIGLSECDTVEGEVTMRMEDGSHQFPNSSLEALCNLPYIGGGQITDDDSHSLMVYPEDGDYIYDNHGSLRYWEIVRIVTNTLTP